MSTVVTVLSICVSASAAYASEFSESFRRGVVAADHSAASAAGAAILEQGGNVVDAAVATSFALAVVRPASCGPGGGGLMMIWDARQQRATALDYRERAPAAATGSMFVDADALAGEHAESASVRGSLAAGIPGTVAGLMYAAETYGTLPVATLLEPAIRLCREGVEIDEHDIQVQRLALQTLRNHRGYEDRFALLLSQYLNGGIAWQPGDRFHSPLLPVLERIAAHGADGFYRGPVAEAIEGLMLRTGGVITLADLQSRIHVERPVLRGTFHGSTILAMPPPSSGGIALLQTLQTLQEWEEQTETMLAALQHNSAEYIHVVAEALKHAFSDRAEFLGDTDFVDVPVERLLSRQYARETAARIDRTQTLPADAYGRFFSVADAGTSHFSVLDAAGNAVACTETINLTWGSFVVVPEYGILLNNQMDDFAARPGEANAFGLLQSAANAVEPGKKPLSSMTPTIVVRNGKAVLATGASGGPRIITATLQVLLNHEVFGMSPRQAVTASRFHHQWSPHELLLERPLAADLGNLLEARGHVVRSTSSLAAAQAAALAETGPAEGARLLGGSDPRKHGIPSGF